MNARPLMRLRLTTAPTQEIGPTAHGTLSIFPVIGGAFEGDLYRTGDIAFVDAVRQGD